jgi:hypothetical protein
MAAANESQGLKIAVAAFVSLTVILAVTSYFLYSNYSSTAAKLVAADDDAKKSNAAATTALSQLQELRTRAGYTNIEDFEALKAAIKKDDDKLTNDLNSIIGEVKKVTTAYKEAGGNDPKVLELEQAAEQTVGSYRDEPNKTFASSLSRLRELISNQAYLTTAYAVDNLNLRKSLAAANGVNQSKLDEQIQAVTKSKSDLENEHNEHEKLRQDLLAKVDKLQTDRDSMSTEYENFKTKTAQAKDDYEKKLGDFRTQLAYYKDMFEKKETVIDSPDGVITDIDYTTKEVRTNLSRRMGARPQMKFAIFDKNAPLPNNHPKANIELVSVDDRGSRGRILPAARTGRNLQSSIDLPDPIQRGDFLYSPAYNPNSPQRFALIGKIDMNRDGRDDRDDMKRMIEGAGGIVEYDLPPPGAGRESGRLTSLCSYYVQDERLPLASQKVSRAGASEAELAFYKKQTEAIREARSLGIRPIEIDSLLTYLGYSPNMVIHGKVESFDEKTSAEILRARGRSGTSRPATGSDPPPSAPEGADDAKKEKEEAAAPK